MTNYDDVATRWCNNVLGGHKLKALKTQRVFPERDRIFSYGHHFEMARALRDKKGEVIAFLINGDTFSPSTSGHQSTVRNAILRTGKPSVIIPHTVLNSAGITEDSIKIIDVLPERTVKTTKTYTEIQPRWRWRDVEEAEYRDPDEAEKERRVTKAHAEAVKRWQDHNNMVWRAIEKEGLFNFWLGRFGRHEVFPPPRPTYESLGRDGNSWRWHQQVRHVVNVERRLFAHHGHHAPEVDVHVADDGTTTYSLTRSRHVLGESLIQGTVEYQQRIKCTACGGTGARPFDGASLSDWYHENWRDHYNHVFACELCDTRGAHFRFRNGDRTRGTGFRWVTRHRTALFLSGFDHQEPTLSYFFSELPTRAPKTVAEAYEALMPDTVKLAVQMGRDVYRQGDIFAVPVLSMTKRELTALGARHERMGNILGTNHAGTDVAYLPDGRTFVRGTLHHVPDFRRPDHVRVPLPKGVWHLVLKNTVPVSA